VKRGGSWDEGSAYMSASVPIQGSPADEAYDLGFRIAAPEPDVGLAAGAAALVLAAGGTGRRRGTSRRHARSASAATATSERSDAEGSGTAMERSSAPVGHAGGIVLTRA
jgi:hypothetical protein